MWLRGGRLLPAAGQHALSTHTPTRARTTLATLLNLPRGGHLHPHWRTLMHAAACRQHTARPAGAVRRGAARTTREGHPRALPPHKHTQRAGPDCVHGSSGSSVGWAGGGVARCGGRAAATTTSAVHAYARPTTLRRTLYRTRARRATPQRPHAHAHSHRIRAAPPHSGTHRMRALGRPLFHVPRGPRSRQPALSTHPRTHAPIEWTHADSTRGQHYSQIFTQPAGTLLPNSLVCHDTRTRERRLPYGSAEPGARPRRLAGAAHTTGRRALAPGAFSPGLCARRAAGSNKSRQPPCTHTKPSQPRQPAPPPSVRGLRNPASTPFRHPLTPACDTPLTQLNASPTTTPAHAPPLPLRHQLPLHLHTPTHL